MLMASKEIDSILSGNLTHSIKLYLIVQLSGFNRHFMWQFFWLVMRVYRFRFEFCLDSVFIFKPKTKTIANDEYNDTHLKHNFT